MSRRGDGINMPTTQNMLEDLQSQIDDVVSGAGSDASSGGLGDLQFFGIQPVSIRKEKHKAVVTLKCAVPSGTVTLRIVLEEYTGSGPTVTVLRRLNGQVEVPDSLISTGGLFTFEFPERLSYNAQYGSPKLVAILDAGGRVKNPTTDLTSTEAFTTLNGAITAASTTIILTDGTSFNTGQRVLIEDEIVLLGVKSTNTFTGCSRAQENTVAAAHASGVTVILAARLLADFLPNSTFQTGPPFPPPLGPAEILIREAGLMPATKKFDAYSLLRCFGPLTATGTGQNLRGAEVDSMQARVMELNEQTTLNGGITNVATTLVLTSGASFSQGDTVFVVDADGTGELIILGAKATNTFTGCTRASQGTPATAHLSSVAVWRMTNLEHNAKDKKLVDTELDQTATDPGGITGRGYVDIPIDHIAPGTPLVWISVRAGAAGEKSQSTGPALFLWAGDIRRAVVGIPELTTCTFTGDTAPPNDGRYLEPTLNFTQPTPSGTRPSAVALTGLPVALEKVLVLRDGVAKKDKDQLDRDDLHTPGLKPVQLDGIKTKKLTAHTFIARVKAFGGATRDATLGLTTGDETGGDLAAPGNLPTPTMKYKRGKLLCRLGVAGLTNIASLYKVELCVTDNSSKSLNLDDLSSETAAAVNTFYDIGLDPGRYPIPIERDLIRTIFAPTGTIICKFKLYNTQGDTTSANSNALDLATLRDVTTAYNPNNILRNGHFTYHDNSVSPGPVAKRWQDYDPRNGSFGNVDQVGKLRFDLAQHRAKWRDTTEENTRFLVQNLGKIFMMSEYYSLIWNILSNGTPTITELVVGLYTQKALSNQISGSAGVNQVTGSGFLTDLIKVGTVIGNGAEWRTVSGGITSTTASLDRSWTAGFGPVNGFALIPQADRLTQFILALTTADKFQRGTILTHSDLDTSRDMYFVVGVRDVIDTTTFLFMDMLCLNAGQESAGYQRSVDLFETNDTDGTENFDTPPTGGSSSGGAQFPGGGIGDPGEVSPILT